MFRGSLRGAAFAAAVIALAQPAAAATIVDTGPVGASRAFGWTLTGNGYAGYPHTFKYAARFALAAPATITSLEVGLFVYYGGALNFSIYNAASGFPESSPALFSAAISPPPSPNHQTGDWAGPTGLSLTLAAGSYWMAVIPPAGSGLFSALGAYPLHPLPYLNYAQQQECCAWDTFNYSFDVRIMGDPAAIGGVPEPQSWALLIAGFGLTGAAMRHTARRRLPQTVAA